MDKWLRYIKPLVKQSNDDFVEEIEMKPIGRHLNKNYVTLKSVYELSELELLEHPITKAAINRGLVCRVTPIFRREASRPESFQKTFGVPTKIGVDGVQAGCSSQTDDMSVLRSEMDQDAREEVVKPPEIGVKAVTAVGPKKSDQPEKKYHQPKDTVDGRTESVQFCRTWVDKASDKKSASENLWVNFKGLPNLSVTYKINSAAIEESIPLIDRRVGHEGEIQRLPVANRRGS